MDFAMTTWRSHAMRLGIEFDLAMTGFIIRKTRAVYASRHVRQMICCRDREFNRR